MIDRFATQFSVVLFSCTFCVSAVAQADTKPRPISATQWLERSVKAARELPYTGVFVHQTAEGANTSRITHLVDRNGVEHERLEALDGPLSEIVRRNEEMFCYSPEDKTVRVDRRSTGRFFPALVTGDVKEIEKHYHIRLGPTERVAGYDCQWVSLDPKDSLRYMQKLCAEVGTGLLLRARLYGDRNQLLEQFMFTQVDVTKSVEKRSLRSRFEQFTGWVKSYSLVKEPATPDTGWSVGNLPAGFKKVTEMVRNLAGRTKPVAHLVYSDGVSHVSVFVEPLEAPIQPFARLSDDGPVAVAVRPVGDHQVTVLGEVPVAAVQAIADGVTRRSR